MILQCYEDVTTKIDKQKTWLYFARKTLVSREIKYTPYYSIASRFNKQTNETDYFILMLHNYVDDRNCKKTMVDNYGRIKINIISIYKESNLKNITKDCNVNIEYVDEDDECIVYKIDI